MSSENGKEHAGFLKSFKFAFQGLRYTIASERNIKVMLAIFVIATVFAIFLRLSETEWAIFLLSSGAVFCAELINTAIETVVDLASPEYHELAKRAKDVAAAATLVLCVFVAILGLIIFISSGIRVFR